MLIVESSFRFSPLRQAHARIAKEKAEAKAPKEVKDRGLERRDAEHGNRASDPSATEKRRTEQNPDRPDARLQPRTHMQPTPTGTTMHVAWIKAVNARLAHEHMRDADTKNERKQTSKGISTQESANEKNEGREAEDGGK